MNYDVKKTAEIIKALRKGKINLTQERAADEIGINIKTYQSLEQGTRGASIDTMCLISEYYQVSLEYLMCGKESSNFIWNDLINNLTEEQRNQLISIASNVIETMGWQNGALAPKKKIID